jgi:hypothetical protein
MSDPFNDKLNNIEFKVNNNKKPDCLIGYPTKDLPAGAVLYSAKGKDWWCSRQQIMTLEPKARATCKKYYGITDNDIVD